MKTVFLVLLIISVGLYIYRNKTKSSICTRGLQVLHHLESPYQTIDLAKDKKTNHIAMFLNGTIQNHTKEFNKSHYAMVDIPIKLLNTPLKNILILGGGDGYPAMRALKQKDVYIKNVEIDHVLIDFVKTNPIMRKYTQDAFNDSRLDLSAMDAYKYIYTEKRKFDVIVYDIARTTTNNTVTDFAPCDDYVVENLLSDGGVLNYTMDLYGNIPEFSDLFRNYCKLKKKSNKKHLILLLQSKEDFDRFSPSCPVGIKKLKEKYPMSEIGIMMYNLKSSCGIYQYNEELYFYISKQPFNKTNEDIEFYPFHNLTSGIP